MNPSGKAISRVSILLFVIFASLFVIQPVSEASGGSGKSNSSQGTPGPKDGDAKKTSSQIQEPPTSTPVKTRPPETKKTHSKINESRTNPKKVLGKVKEKKARPVERKKTATEGSAATASATGTPTPSNSTPTVTAMPKSTVTPMSKSTIPALVRAKLVNPSGNKAILVLSGVRPGTKVKVTISNVSRKK